MMDTTVRKVLCENLIKRFFSGLHSIKKMEQKEEDIKRFWKKMLTVTYYIVFVELSEVFLY